MFSRAYFGGSYFSPRYWPGGGSAITPPVVPPPGTSSYTATSLTSAINQLALALRDPQNSYWSRGEICNAIIEALRMFQALTGYFRERPTFETIALQPFYDLREFIPDEYAFTVTDLQILAEIQAHLLEPIANPWTGTDQFSIASIQSAIENIRNQFLFDTGIYIERELQEGPAPPESRVALDENTIHVRRVGWAPLSDE